MGPASSTRLLRYDQTALQRLLDDLDRQNKPGGHEARANERHTYRTNSLLVEVVGPGGTVAGYNAVARNISSEGIGLLTGSVVYPGSRCTVHLQTLDDRTHRVAGRVMRCRYLTGTRSVHEVGIRFDEPVDLALFSRTAVPANVLLAEDSEPTAKLIRRLLEPLNVELVHVSDGLQAVAAATAQTFDLILMDIEMPALDGLEAIKRLRRAGYLRPIVALSALSDAASLAQYAGAGCDDYIVKPFGRDAILASLRKFTPAPLISSVLLTDPSMGPLVDEYVGRLRAAASELEASFAAKQLDEISRLLRALWGEAGAFGFEAIAVAAQLSDAALKAKAKDMRLRITELVALCRAARLSSGSVAG